MLLVNEILNGRYRIVRQLGQGGMGAVYEAQDNTFDTTCAIKEIMIDTAKAPSAHQQDIIKSAFEREAKLLAKIKHETVPHVRDYFSHDSRQFLVMELVEGKDLGDLMEERKTPFPLEDVVRWMRQLLDGLDYLHTQSPPIYHRDIKPQNLKLTPRGKIKLLDFGIAKGGPAETTSASTVGNQTFVAATLNYSPIEQTYRVLDPVFREVLLQRFEAKIKVVMDQNADARSDIYALGATAYHLLTGTLPIDSLKRTTEVWSGKADPLANPATLNAEIPPAIANLLMKSMEIDRDHRYSTALEMDQALSQAIGGTPAHSTNPTPDTAPTVFHGFDTSGSDTNAPTMQIPAEQAAQQLGSVISEQTIQAQNVNPPPTGNQFDTGGSQQTPPPAGNPFDTGGQQQPPAGNPFDTGGQQQAHAAGLAAGAGAGASGGFGAGAGGFSGQQFSTPAIAPQKRRGKALLIAIPLLALLFLAVGGAGAGYWIWKQSQTISTTPTPTPSASPAVSPSASPTEKASKSETPTPSPSVTPSPSETKVATTAPTPVRTPPPAVRTPKPRSTVRRNSDCIFTGDC
jgi:serine/threonine protein kinase